MGTALHVPVKFAIYPVNDAIIYKLTEKKGNTVMNNQLKEKYGLITAIAMVVGIVIGSGVFFKAEKVLDSTGGNLPFGILAWGIGGVIMMICAYTFSVLATRYSHVNGLVDYAEATVGRGYAYLVGWFSTFIYYPAMTSVLAWVSARYFCVILGWDITGGPCMVVTCLFLVGSYAVNALSPVLAGKFQVATTVIKLIPLYLMAIVGTVVGLCNGMTVENFTSVVSRDISTGNALLTAVVATAFAYEGWIIATSINAELKNAKRNLPIALLAGSTIIVLTYILYYVGLAGGVGNEELMKSGEAGAQLAFGNVFGKIGGTTLFVFVVISCLGTLNGLMLASTRGMYAIAARKNGPRPALFEDVSAHTNMPANSSVVGLLMCALWLTYFYGANLVEKPWFGPVVFDSSELPIVTIYAIYMPIILRMMVKEKSLHPVKRFLFPILTLLCCLFMIFAAVIAHGMGVVWYLLVFACIMAISVFFYKKEEKTV